MGPSQICECPFREPRVFTIAHILLVTLLGITSVAAGYMISLFMFCFCSGFCKALRSNTGKFYLLAMIKLYNILHRPLHETIGT